MDVIKSVDAYIKETGTEKGRGVFAIRSFQKGELVEVAPVIVMYRPFFKVPPVLQTVVYSWTHLAHLSRPAFAVALGFGSMYNHQNPANLTYKAYLEDKTIHFIARTEISKDDELTINYNPDGASGISSSDEWFARRKMAPV